MRAAGVDLGSNSFRLLVAEVTRDHLHVLARKLVIVRLGHELAHNRLLAPPAVALALSTLTAFKKIIDHYRPQTVRACGTAALRLATNRDDFLELANGALGLAIEIISGQEEAGLAVLGTLARLDRNRALPLLLADVGGGSTELAILAGGDDDRQRQGQTLRTDLPAPVRAVSLDMGAANLTERFLKKPRPSNRETDNLSNYVRKELATALPKIFEAGKDTPPLIIGCGGTATALTGLALGLNRYDHDLVQNHVLTTGDLDRLWKRLVCLSAGERNLLPALDRGRGEILPAGTRIYQLLLEQLAADRMTVSDAGLVEGILLSGAASATPRTTP